MKRTEYIILSGAALLFAACSAADEPFQTLDAPVAAIVAGGIDDVRSRASGTRWDSEDKIGISATSSGSTQYSNMCYKTADGDGNFEHDGAGIFFQDTEAVNFSAYYPFTGPEGSSAGIISGVSTENQAEQKDFDFLFARSEAVRYTKPAVNLSFSHKMARIVLNISIDEESTGLAAGDVRDGSYSLGGIRLSGDFDTEAGSAAATGDVTDDWRFSVNARPTDNENGSIRYYSLIVFPQDIEKLTFRAEIKGNAYAGVFKDLSLTAGTTCAFDISVRKTELLIVNQILEITDMTGGGQGSGTATVFDHFNGHDAVLMREATADLPALYVATCNIGADSPEDAGLYFWWGDIVGYTVDENGKTNFDFSENNPAIVTHNKTIEELRREGYIDDNNNLVPEKDAARQHWGGSWRMPTKEDMEWLLATENCTWIPNDAGGIDIQSKSTGGEIFLPAAGNCVGNVLYNPKMRFYWLSKAATTVSVSDNYAGGYSYNSAFIIIGFETCGGMPLRPVLQLPVR